MTGSERLKHGMAAILGELENLYAQDLIGAVQINIALRDGNVRTLKAYDDGFRILLIAAAAIGQLGFAFFAPYACAHAREGHDGSAVCRGGGNNHLARRPPNAPPTHGFSRLHAMR